MRVALLTALLAAPLAAQVELPRFSQAVEVRVTNVDVIVTDDRGNHVHGLTKDDFEIYDSGKRQDITNLSEVTTKAAAPPPVPTAAATTTSAPTPSAPARRVVIFFDALSTSRDQRRRMLPALKQLVGDLGANDEAMVVIWNRTVKVLAAPTNDHAALEKALTKAAGEISMKSERLTMFTDLSAGLPAPAGGVSGAAIQRAERTMQARQDIREATADLNDSARALRGILMRLNGLDGRKALILISSGFSFRPGADAASPDEADALLQMEGVRAPDLLRSLAEAANAAGVTIYTMHGEGLSSGMSATTTGLVDAASVVDGSALLQSMRTSGSSIDGLTYLAAETGGLVAANTNTFMKAVQHIEADLDSYYSIGYRPAETNVNNNRTVEVRTKNRSYHVRARRTALDRSPDAELTDRIFAALLFPSSGSNSLEISLQRGAVDSRQRNRVKVPIDVRIPMARLTLQSDGGDQLNADISVLIASADANGGVSSIERFRQLIPIRRAQLPTLSTRYYTYGIDIDLRTTSADNRFAVAVVDNVSKEWSVVSLNVGATK